MTYILHYYIFELEGYKKRKKIDLENDLWIVRNKERWCSQWQTAKKTKTRKNDVCIALLNF